MRILMYYNSFSSEKNTHPKEKGKKGKNGGKKHKAFPNSRKRVNDYYDDNI